MRVKEFSLSKPLVQVSMEVMGDTLFAGVLRSTSKIPS
jgi:hypothetical protein